MPAGGEDLAGTCLDVLEAAAVVDLKEGKGAGACLATSLDPATYAQGAAGQRNAAVLALQHCGHHGAAVGARVGRHQVGLLLLSPQGGLQVGGAAWIAEG